MREHHRRLYLQLLAEIEAYRKSSDSICRWIELSFMATERAWVKVRQMTTFDFESDTEEILFFKHVKPQFTGLLEFFTLLYKAEVFAPEDTNEQLNYWTLELINCGKFLNDHCDFYEYHKQQKTEKDSQYFLRINHLAIETGAKFFGDGNMMTSHDRLVASIVAREYLINYIEQKLQKEQ